ncbi:MAG: hypothetical protein IT373_02120 [Polyangiaceae bacterium]|nr:hypothetical protein [Polyangiaceae bacterium]
MKTTSKRFCLAAATVAAFALPMALARDGQADGPVKHTAESCQNAYAILGWLQEPDVALARKCAELDKTCLAKPKVEGTPACTEWRLQCWKRARLAPDQELTEENWPGPTRKKVWKKIGFIMAVRKFWQMVPSYEPGRAQQVSFRQYGVKDRSDVTAFVARCGSGGTCNAVADTFYKWYRHIGIPQVHCGPLPYMLEGETTPDIPTPTPEEIEAGNRGGGSYSGGTLGEPSLEEFD